MNSLPPYFVHNITTFFPNGAAWLTTLPSQLEEVAARWNLTIGEAVPKLSFNYVCFATRTDGTPVILKMGVPSEETRSEIEALQWYQGRGVVRVLEADADHGWVLLERIFPGTPLSAIEDDDVATHIAAELMQQLWVPLPTNHPFIPMAQWTNALPQLRVAVNTGTSPYRASLVDRAEATFAQPVEQPVLLHADFHHDNILLRRESRGSSLLSPLSAVPSDWVVIDGKGIAGPPLYEVGPFLHNPFPRVSTHPNLSALLSRRVAILAEHLAVPRVDIINWGVAFCVLNSWWHYSTGGEDWNLFLRVTETLADMG